MFPLDLAGVSLEVGATAFSVGAATITTAPNDHGAMPNFAVRLDVLPRRASLVYSSDTRACDTVVALARGADTLIHEATFRERDRERYGAHATARDAGAIAARAGVRRLILTHVDCDYHDDLEPLRVEASEAFGGPVEIARELVAYPF